MIRTATLQDWLLHPPVRRAVSREFRTFLLEYTNEIGDSVYGARINNLGERNLESLEVDYSHLRSTRATIAKFLAQCPTEVLKVLEIFRIILINRFLIRLHCRLFSSTSQHTIRSTLKSMFELQICQRDFLSVISVKTN